MSSPRTRESKEEVQFAFVQTYYTLQQLQEANPEVFKSIASDLVSIRKERFNSLDEAENHIHSSPWSNSNPKFKSCIVKLRSTTPSRVSDIIAIYPGPHYYPILSPYLKLLGLKKGFARWTEDRDRLRAKFATGIKNPSYLSEGVGFKLFGSSTGESLMSSTSTAPEKTPTLPSPLKPGS